MPLLAALLPLAWLVGLLALVIVVLPEQHPGFEGTGHLPLLLAGAVAAVIARAYGHRWPAIEAGILRAIQLAMGALLILCVIGMLMGTWIVGGVVPALIHWGLELLAPSYFLPTACAVCSVVSLVSGSSWSTAGTVGLALIGVGGALGVDPAMTAGAVVSGAYFGDKLSPMSDTTNLAPAMAGTDLFSHVRHMVWTTTPSWLIAMTVYTVLSLGSDTNPDAASVDAIQTAIAAEFEPSVWHLVPLVLVIGLVVRGLPALPILLLGTVLGGLLAVVLEGASVAEVLIAAMDGYKSSSGDPAVDELLSRGGLMSMAKTVLLVLCAMTFGGVMESTGMLATLAARMLRLAHSTGSLIAVTVLTCCGINVIVGDQYIAIVVPGRMYAAAYRERGLHPKNLSRALEDAGTLTSPLVPWNTCGAFMAATLGVATAAYLPYAVLNLVNPLVSIVYGYLGITITPLPRAPE
ncbi:MAG: Na+/H+ antiporter NhaC [Deltaproteobacteria bacterium]|nr:Na+/H+ antiporter NhaC [Nannocystaceae bacterium]